MPDEAMLEPEIEMRVAMPAAPEAAEIVPTPEPSGGGACVPAKAQLPGEIAEPALDWRDEIVAKMQDYRTRRKPRAPKYPSLQMPLQLPVEPQETFDSFRAASTDVSLSANALELTVQSTPVAAQRGPELVETLSLAPAQPESVPQPVPPTNLIEFPRSMESQAWDGLAEPVVEQPRILDAPELVPPEPALGGILLEAPQDPSPDSAADVPLRPASIARRLCALAVDAIVVGCGVVVWGWIASRVTHEFPPRAQLLISASIATTVLWLSYQYLLMVYSGATLGMRACRLELAALDESSPGRESRRWRLLASLLSAASMMLGYAWVLLDENKLCWHDRISHTYLRVREP